MGEEVDDDSIWDWTEYFFYERYPRVGAYGISHNGEWFAGVPYDNKVPEPPYRFRKPMFQMWANIFFVGRQYCHRLRLSGFSSMTGATMPVGGVAGSRTRKT